MPTPKKRTTSAVDRSAAEPARRKPGRRPAVNSPQAFDIIPRSQVKPSTNARPVITPNRPLQPDNTLVTVNTTAIDGATPQLSHRPLKLTPTGDVSAEDVVVEASTASQLGKLSDESHDALQTPPVAIPGADPEAIKEAISRRHADGEKTIEELSAEAETPVSEEASLDEAFAELGYAKADVKPEAAEKAEEPQEPEEKPVKEVTTAAEPEPEPEPEPEVTAAEPEPDQPKPVPGTVEHALHDETRQAIEHSPALKSELQNLADEDDKKEKLPEDHPHHDLYGGKPVIVIHKHKKSSAASVILMILICLVVAVAIADVLIDAEVVNLNFDVPHTDYL